MDRRGALILAGLFAAALLAKLPILHAPPYGDEGLFLQGAAHPFQAPAGILHPDGSPITFPRSFPLERPLFYAVSWLPAQGGFAAFRLWSAAVGALLAPLAYVLVRDSGARRTTGVLAGLAVAVAPPLVVWGTYTQTDALMTLLLGLALLARSRGRPAAAALLLLAAVWTKEAAFAAACAVLAVEAWRARDRRTAWFALPVALGLAPLLLAIATGFPVPGTHETAFHLQLADAAFLTPWLVPVLAVGVALPRSRRWAATGLAGGGLLLAMHAARYSVQAWYLVPSVFLALVGAAAAADAAWDAPWRSRVARAAPALFAVVIVLTVVLVPAGPARAALRPLSGDGGDSLAGTYAYETRLRDRDLAGALAALPLDGLHDLATTGVYHAHLYALAPHFAHLWADFPDAGTPAARARALAARMEANGTWTVVGPSGDALAAAVRSTYADCTVWQQGQYAVIVATRCAGRAGRLASTTT